MYSTANNTYYGHIFFVPESPVHLLQKGRRNAAVKSLKKYRGYLNSQEIEEEILLMESAIGNKKGAALSSLIFNQPTRR